MIYLLEDDDSIRDLVIYTLNSQSMEARGFALPSLFWQAVEEAVPDPEFPAGEMYILGEYCQDLLGNYINLYYGSFAALAEKEDWGRQDWEDELYTTFSHELTHHMESRGGLHALDDRDAEELARWREEYRTS